MNRILATLFLSVLAVAVSAQSQTPAVPGTMPYGKVDVADLELKACEFEKDANAEVLFDKGDLYFDQQFNIIVQRHKRIKIFNENGMKEAEIRIPYQGGNRLEYITGLQAQTINLVNGKPEIIKLDKSQIFTKNIDKVRNEIAFTFPNVKAGSIIEYKYAWNTVSYSNFPAWFFQQKIPVRYSEYITSVPEYFTYRTQVRTYEPFVKNTSKTEAQVGYMSDKNERAMANIHSLPDEAYMSSYADNYQCLIFQLTNITSHQAGIFKTYSDTWAKVGGILADDEDFGKQLKKKLKGEEVILANAAKLKGDDKIAYIFNEVKNTMKWDGVDRWYTTEGTPTAWEKKTGNSAEINIILYHLLKQAGLDVYPMVVSTREHGKVRPYHTSLSQFNRAVVYMPVSEDKEYVLDATGKYNVFNEIPAELLNSSGLYIDKGKELYDIVSLEKLTPSSQTVFVTAQIKPDGKLEGTTNIRSSSYNRLNAIERYKTDGEKKYIDYLRNDDNGIKIASLKFENLDVDTLPLLHTINFTADLSGSDDTYIYLNPNLFSSLRKNPFLAENRLTDIEFGYNRNFSIGGRYTMPAGFKVDAMPKSGKIVMPDKSISMSRIVGEQDGVISIRYVVEFSSPIYLKKDYPDFREFVKVLYEMLNEQIILKKA
ncbi:DUF3857 domain-containing protein [Mucilaginibacter auburnensis]|uniref:Uncharacterized protein DUF3857 n=1 Tax=Mucilaginibacter auburnensis TaxID=1457233 RepID=A0A2H9VS72_9SPHI|nr:DUF3857 domain-containing protein [Mucilaginibacter auburnensis]PJJ83673.1 uncharacterized protein DUF3857 [Mucilaginibacter auburnensis]